MLATADFRYRRRR